MRLQHCDECGEIRFPPLPSCPNCRCREFNVEIAQGTGRIYSWIRVNRVVAELSEMEIPATYVVTELDEGVRMIGRLEGDRVAGIGDEVEAIYVDWSDWTEVRFQLTLHSGATANREGGAA
jgi:uncharacterized OB-fold protein